MGEAEDPVEDVSTAKERERRWRPTRPVSGHDFSTLPKHENLSPPQWQGQVQQLRVDEREKEPSS